MPRAPQSTPEQPRAKLAFPDVIVLSMHSHSHHLLMVPRHYSPWPLSRPPHSGPIRVMKCYSVCHNFLQGPVTVQRARWHRVSRYTVYLRWAMYTVQCSLPM